MSWSFFHIAADFSEYRQAAGATTPNVARHRRLIDAGLFSCDRIFRRLSFASRRLAILRRQSIWRLGRGDWDWCCAVRSGLNREETNRLLTRDEARRIAAAGICFVIAVFI